MAEILTFPPRGHYLLEKLQGYFAGRRRTVDLERVAKAVKARPNDVAWALEVMVRRGALVQTHQRLRLSDGPNAA